MDQRVAQRFSVSTTSSRTLLLVALSTALLALAIPVTVFTVQQNQDIRPRAAAPAPSIDPTDPESLRQALLSTRAQLNGLICAYSGNHPAGTVMAYEIDDRQLFTFPRGANELTFGISVAPGRYTFFFKPDDTTLPAYGYTKHGLCALGEFPCGDHTLLIEQVQRGDTIGQINICDPDYPDNGLPRNLKK